MSFASRVCLKEGDLQIISYGNGAAYEVRDGNKSMFVQGDDAMRFRLLWDGYEPSTLYPTFKVAMDAWGYELKEREG